MTDASDGTGSNRRRQRRRENEAGCEAADEVAKRSRSGDIPANDPESLCQGAFDDGQSVAQPLAFGDSAAVWAVKPDRMNFIEVGHGAISIGHIAELGDGGHVAIHGVDGLESYEFWHVRRKLGQPALEIGRIIMGEDHLLRPAMPDTLDHPG